MPEVRKMAGLKRLNQKWLGFFLRYLFYRFTFLSPLPSTPLPLYIFIGGFLCAMLGIHRSSFSSKIVTHQLGLFFLVTVIDSPHLHSEGWTFWQIKSQWTKIVGKARTLSNVQDQQNQLWSLQLFMELHPSEPMCIFLCICFTMRWLVKGKQWGKNLSVFLAKTDALLSSW